MVNPKRIASRAPAPARSSGPRPAHSGPPRPRRRGSDQVLAAVALLIVGGLAGVAIVGLAGSRAPSESNAVSEAPSDDTGTASSDAPIESAAPVSPVLEALMPAAIDGVALTVQSAVDATSLSSSPDGRALNAAIVHLGKDTTDLEIAIAFDESGAIDLTILGFRSDGVTADQMADVVLSAWLAAGTPGVTTTSLTWSGTSVRRISYGDEGPDEYLVTVDDSVFVLETTDEAVAQTTVAALAGAGAVSPGPTAHAPAEPSPSA